MQVYPDSPPKKKNIYIVTLGKTNLGKSMAREKENDKINKIPYTLFEYLFLMSTPWFKWPYALTFIKLLIIYYNLQVSDGYI